MFAPVYLDYNATSPLDAAVLEAMMPWLEAQFGNASSRHEYGRAARRAVDEARQQLAEAMDAHPTEIVFTSGGSESNNLFLKGAAACLRPGGLAVSSVEHPCVTRAALQLARQGWSLTQVAVDAEGRVARDAWRDCLAARPKLLSVMRANNETGVLQDIAALAEEARGSGAWFHSDVVQAFGKVPVSFRELNAAGVHALTVSAHKLGGPKGAAALVLDKRLELSPLIAGGGHERGLRSGTENVPAIVGFGVAAQRARQRLQESAERLTVLRDRLEHGLLSLGARLFGAGAERLPNTCYFALPHLEGETLVGKLDREGFAVASGAACSSANPEPSHVLAAMGVAPEVARGAVRVSLGEASTLQQIEDFLNALRRTTSTLREMTAVSTMAAA